MILYMSHLNDFAGLHEQDKSKSSHLFLGTLPYMVDDIFYANRNSSSS